MLNKIKPVTALKNPEHLQEWRVYPYSLTEKLKQAVGSVELHLLSQSWKKSSWWDKYMLGILDSSLFLREILMKNQEQIYWYARTLIPQTCYEAAPDFFQLLDRESLGSLIFNHSRVQRLKLSNYPIDSQCLEFSWLKKEGIHIEGIIWVRLAEYAVAPGASFYVIELLLPELEKI